MTNDFKGGMGWNPKIISEFLKILKTEDLKKIELYLDENNYLEEIENNTKTVVIAQIIGKQTSLEVLDFLFESGFKEVLSERNNLIEALFAACKNSNMKAIEYTIDKINKGKEPITRKEITQCYLNSCKKDNLEIINYFLMDKGLPYNADINAHSGSGLIHLLEQNNVDIIKELVLSKNYIKNADIHTANDRFLKIAIQQEKIDIILWCINDLNITKTKNLIIFFDTNPEYKEIEKLFDAKILHEQLVQDLSSTLISKVKKNKL